ncbi:myosin-11-like [Juglans regia]|uniref:Myosin-11-like n=1 Tax=Juglans regia TaxID=51240 RepID=A0A6P9E6S7_JUGRE|nr:myosin-11-like [Juglans regia]
MGTNKGPEISSYRQKWDKIFDGLVHMLQSQQAQVETLAKERKLLEERIRAQHERWVSDLSLYEDRISQIKGVLVVQEMARSLEATKSDFAMSLKRREAFLDNLKLEHAESDLSDFKALLDYLSHKSPDPKDLSLRKVGDLEGEEQCSKLLEGEIRRLTHEYEKLASEKSSEVSALLAEKNFVWNQYKIMENDYNSKLRSNYSEVKQENETIKKLLGNMEQLQSLNDKKDEMIARLTNKVAKMEADMNKLNEETSKLSQELDFLRTSGSAAAVTPVLNRCMVGAKPCLGAKNSGRDRSNMNAKKESSAARGPDSVKDNEQGSRGFKRKGVNVTILETPKLFSSNFKVPKLKMHIR